jgi:hypothetical protein
VSLDD